ncbi:extracellular solute-binding protein [Jatrophihabitans telluris]|uniref:Extracellular solute-binding protein n=1 Tax=Jatrophihabitans telluris TaxID=2038343 RepID=A0ABY4R1D1_9ACTN|nr:extracellular solute-binding protein [Jatrophihabitans telluris]UQX89061.1 extracellular solute-binding protein [Jatrophihabitans telluris]
MKHQPSHTIARSCLVAGLALVTALATACTGGGSNKAAAPASVIATDASHAPTSITVWSFNTLAKEVKAFQDDLGRLHQKYPWLTVKFVPGKDDAAFAKAVAAGDPPDVFISTAPDYVGQFCHNGTVLDMSQYLKLANIDVTKTFPAASLVYTQYQGKQCALPLLTDAYGLYYNKKMFAAAGIASPPKTFSELIDDAKKLTVKNADGSIKTFGLVTRTDYNLNANIFTGVHTNSKFYDAAGKATFASDPGWANILQLDKSLQDFYGAGNVQKFVGQYQPHSDDAANAFVKGAAAMEYDGEWHIGEIADEAPNLDYGIAPFPVPDDQLSRYGVGNTQGTVVYIPSRTKHAQEAYFAAQQLTTDTTFLTTLADAVSNVPSTFDSLKAWDQAGNEHWKAMIDILTNPGSYYKQLTAAGAQDATAWGTFTQNYERGKAGDLTAALKKFDQQVNTMNAQAGQ